MAAYLKSGQRIGISLKTSKSWGSYVFDHLTRNGIVLRDIDANSYIQFIPWHNIERVTWTDEVPELLEMVEKALDAR